MKVKHMKKKTFVILCAVCLFISIILLPRNAGEIRTAVVNKENGDIAFCYYEYTSGPSVIQITVCDKDGKSLYSKSFATGKSPDMIFVGENLCMVVHYGTKETKYFYDREGNETYVNISSEEIKAPASFEEWDYCLSNFTLRNGDCEYRYEQPGFFRHRAKLTINNGDNVMVIYESPEKK